MKNGETLFFCLKIWFIPSLFVITCTLLVELFILFSLPLVGNMKGMLLKIILA